MPFSGKVHIIIQQSMDIRKEDVKREKLFTLGSELQRMKLVIDLCKVEELNTCLSKVGQPEWKKLSRDLKPSMLSLIQPKLWEHPWEEFMLTVSSCLNKIIALTSLLLTYNNDIMREILQLIAEALQRLNNIILHTFRKRHKILELMEEFSLGTFMLNLEYKDLIFQVLHNFYTRITLAHPKCVKKSM